MKKYLSLVLALCAFAAADSAQPGGGKNGGDHEADLRSIVEAERGFARTSVEKGTRAAFIDNLADDGVLFRPGPVNGKKWWSERPSRPGVLSWQPVYADVAWAGDLGYTTGPWEFREKSLEDKPVAFGQYVTIWKRQADGAWKVAVDLGTSNPPPQAPAPEVKFPEGDEVNKKLKPAAADAPGGLARILKLEGDFAKRMAGKDGAEAFLSFAADDVRLFREKSFPGVGLETARAMLAGKSGDWTWRPAKADISRSGDLGYAYGAYEFRAGDGKAGESGSYLRIWKRQRRGGKWKIVLDILNPLPPKTAAG
jgi:ketosteroid isomerase-like protein